MPKPQMGQGVIVGNNVQFGKDVIIWNYVIIGDGTRIGDGSRIGSFCDVGRDVTVGRRCIVQAHVTISNECKLGDDVFIGPNSSLLNDKFPHSRCLTPSIVKDRVIIGGCVTILPNVTVNEDSVVAAGSVVTKTVPPNTVVRGMPAKLMMARQDYEARRKAFIQTRRAGTPGSPSGSSGVQRAT